MRIGPSRRAATVAGAALLASALALTLAGPAVASDGGGSVRTYSVHPLMRQYSSSVPAALPAPSECIAAYGLACYSPDLVRKAYGIPAGWTGKGKTIAIIDAYGSPTAADDLELFSEFFGLPSADLHVYYPAGQPVIHDADEQELADGWAGETSLDLQWAHAIAPAARINLVVTPTPDDKPIADAEQYVVDHKLGDVLSMSYGEDEVDPEFDPQLVKREAKIFEKAAQQGISVFASAGDGGAGDGYKKAVASYPASDPNVTAVGGTNLYIGDDGSYQGETVWNDADPSVCPFTCTTPDEDGNPVPTIFGATGGAPSTVFTAESYQKAASGQKARTTSDVAYNASVYTAVMVFFGGDGSLYFMGGTSAGAPQWAAIAALLDEQAGRNLGQLNESLYNVADSKAYPAAFHDVTKGNNAFYVGDTDALGQGFKAGKGYDLPTGLGSPNVSELAKALKAASSKPCAPGQGGPGNGGPGGPGSGNGAGPGSGNGHPGGGTPGNGNPGNGGPGNGAPGNGNGNGHGSPGHGNPGNGNPGHGNPGQGGPGQGRCPGLGLH